jgi:glycosyltransferase involved in cell wall biosynthesis
VPIKYHDSAPGLKPHIIFLTRSVGFPNGMAASQRVKLLARSLVEREMDVTVLCTQVSERPPLIENTETKGTYCGIHYEYTTGATTRSRYFLVRRWRELRGILVAILRLIELKYRKNATGVFYYGNILVNMPSQWIFFMAVRLLKLPLMVDVCERPWTMKQEGTLKGKGISPLWGAQGIVVISNFLNNWAIQEKARTKSNMKILEVPILVDINEQHPENYLQGNPTVLFAGSPFYDQTIQFILDAMAFVWKKYPECTLVITGFQIGEPASEMVIKKIKEQSLTGRVELAGYLPRNELLNKYAQASALLIPLFDDIRSRARFPTKIGEYLASNRPIVTNSVGEAARYFVDGKNAYMCAPGDAILYGKKIIEVLENHDEATRVGIAGRKLAEENFHYLIHSQRFANFVDSLCH